MKNKQLMTLLLLLISSSLFAADIHVYSGGSIQNAVNSAASSDRVVIHAGTYSQNVSIVSRTNLTITSAGDGEVIIQGNGTDANTFWVQNSSSITISYLTIKNTRKLVWSVGISVIGTGNNIQIIGNKLTDISYRSGAYDPTDNPDNHGAQFQGVNAISVTGDNASTAITNVIIRDNEVSYCMTGWSEAIALKGNVNGFTVENNKVHHITNIGIDAFGLGTYPTITTNNQARNGTIIKNEVYNCICNYTDNGAIYVDGGLSISIMNNKVYNSKYGITIGCENQMNKPDGATEFIEVRNNLVYNNSRAGIMVGTGGDDDGQQGITRNCKVTGNTFVKNATSDQWASEVMLQNANNIEFYNNIFYGLWPQIGTVNNGSVSNTFGHNIFFSGTGVTVSFSKQTGTSTWTSQTFAQFKADHSDASSTSVDPRLVNAAIGSLDAHLQSTSPAINSGKPGFATIANEKDIDGQNRIAGGTVDIGIDESGSTGTVAVTGVSVSPTSASIAVGATQQLTVTITPSNATNQNRTWSSSNSAVATVNSSGMVSGVAAGTATITATTQDGNFTANSNITVTGGGGGLPSPWVTANVGAVGATGSASHSSGTFTVVGSGADIYGDADEFRYVYRSLNGNGEIKARVASLTNTDPWAKAGVMIRENLTANANHAFCALTPTNGAIFQRHLVSGNVTNQTQVTGVTAPRWVRVVRSGNTFTAYYSSNGTAWTQIATETISMATTVYVGLAVTSHNDGVLCTGSFDNVTASTTSNVAVTGVSVSPTSATLSVSGTQQLTATIAPANATNQNRTWSSSNTAVATVNSSGLVTAVSAGTATITVTTQDGGFTANSNITVSSGSITITINGNLSDWSSVSAIATATGQTSTSLKAYSNATTLYFGIAGSGMSATDYQIFINADNNTATGYQDNVFTASGADFMIENGTFYRSTGTAWGWNSASATINVSKNTGVTELSINRSAFSSPALSSSIKVAYKDIVNWTAVSKLPSSGAYPTYVLPGGRIDVSDNAAVEDIGSETLYPNPTHGNSAELNFVVPSKSEVSVLTLDMQGREVSNLDLGVKDAGRYSHHIDTSSFTKGLYVVRLNVGGKIKSFKLVHD
jgi:uncharacterized protein YjdB